MSVLGTKLHLPAPRRRLVQRARITDQLRVGAADAPRLVLVAAPAGFGKTTLLAQWLAAVRRVTANCFLENNTSLRLMERVGMRRELHAVRESLHRSGQWLDTVGYAILKEEWSPT